MATTVERSAAAGADRPARRRPVAALLARPVLLAALGAACISPSGVLVRLAGVSAGTTTFYRCLLALPGLFLLGAAEQRRLGPRAWRERATTLVAGGFLGVDLVAWTHSIYDVGAGIATVLGNLQVLFVAAIAWAIHRERPGGRFLAALPVVIGGVVLVSGLTGTTGSGYHPAAGVIFGVAASLAYSAYLLILRRSATHSAHVAGVLADATLGALLAGAALAWPIGELQFAVAPRSLFWLAVLALVSQTLGWLLITSALSRLPAAVSSLLLLLQPAAAVALAAVVLSQQPTALQLVGAVAVCGGVLLATRRTGAAELGAPEPVPLDELTS